MKKYKPLFSLRSGYTVDGCMSAERILKNLVLLVVLATIISVLSWAICL